MKKIVIRGPIFSKSGYGEHARLVFRALSERPDLYDIYIQPTVWGNTSWTLKETEEVKKIKECVVKAHEFPEGGIYDVSMQIQLPNEWENVATYNIGVTAAIETDKAPPQWIANANNVIDEIITISNHSKLSMITPNYIAVDKETNHQIPFKLDKKISVIGFPAKTYTSQNSTNFLDGVTTKFNFLSVLQACPRKNLNSLVQWFVEEFHDNEDVGLVLKANKVCNTHIDRRQLMSELKILLKDYQEKKCKIYLFHGGLEEEELHSLYTDEKIKCYVTTTHGEGFGLPIFEAAYSGLPVVAPAWSGQTDYLYANVENKKSKRVKRTPLFTKIKYSILPVQKEAIAENIITEDSNWCFPQEKSFKKSIRNVYESLAHKQSMAKQLQEHIHKNYSKEKIYSQYSGILEEHFKTVVDDVDDWFNNMQAEIVEFD